MSRMGQRRQTAGSNQYGRWVHVQHALTAALLVLLSEYIAGAQSPPPSAPWTPTLAAPLPEPPSAPWHVALAPEPLPAGDSVPVPLPPAAPAFVPPPPHRQPSAEDVDALMMRLDELEKKVAQAAEAKQPAAAKNPVAEALPEITWTDLSAEKWTLKPGAQMQLDSINWADHTSTIPAFNYVEFRRLRLMVDGVGYGVYDFRVQMEFEPESNEAFNGPVTEVRDAYLSMNELPAVYRRGRIGHFFVPFGLEQVTNDVLGEFLERSIPANGVFTAERKTGFAFYGVSDDLNTTWTNGFFIDGLNEATKERVDNNQGQRISARVTHLPYYDEPSNGRYLIHTGAGVMYTHDQDNLVRFRTRPDIHEGPYLIDTGNMAADNFIVGNVELATVWGPWAMQSEAFYTNVDLDVGGNTPSWGMYVHSSYFLTGENRTYERFGQHGAQFGRVQPYSNFFLVPGGCGPGAWEVKGRWSTLSLTEYGAGQYNDFTFGFNWYWTPNIRVMFDWIHPFTSSEAVYGETQSDIIGMRFDFNT